ncbi:probable glucuronosyltransferase Os01g0926700 isoform X1 [Humulus lupulus]|uniref:probable glucuronosyltransferase Os01g0926700 isoform X1 n=2 Tax=Humulus lupulus TaxID=3486 RepID=UPI002B4026F2|nr:probable glucuronosyltransferase Os01g0926700 isoform X1 [Humulus lupulus]
MRSMSNKGRALGAHQHFSCTRTHQIGALLLVVFTKLFDRPRASTATSFSPDLLRTYGRPPLLTDGGDLSWPQRGYGPHLDLKIYVYDEDEVDGLKALMYGRDGRITPKDCLKGQWGTQVKIHKLLLQSRFRTRKKEEADLFFVPAYVKCVRMMVGLKDKEITETYVKVLNQLPYFRLSGGRNHIFVFPSGAGAHLFKSWEIYINRSIILTPEVLYY